MSRPVFRIEVDLSQQDTVYFLPLAPRSRDHGERLKLGVRLKITHDDPAHDELTISAISFSFPGTSLGSRDMDMVPEKNMDPVGGKLRRGETANWFNGSWRDASDAWHHNQVYLDAPAPRRLRIAIRCEETSEAFTQTFDLLPHRGTPLLLPFAVEDLADDEYIVTSAVHNYNGPPNGTQIFAHDISIQARINGNWTRTRTGTATTNEDIRSFGRPVRAQGDGVVHKIETGFWDNDYDAGNRTDHYGSNTVTIDYGNLRVDYKHLRRDSINPNLAVGDLVWPGRKLGEAGNSGNTKGAPHLHMECRLVPGSKLCGMTFRNSWMLEKALVPADNGPGRRVRLEGQGICEQQAALRPFGTRHAPVGPDVSVAEYEAIVAEVFGGVDAGGDGFVIINGKLTRVPPRGIRWDLLNSVVALDETDELGKAAASRRVKTIAQAIDKALQSLKKGL
jgi:murein DD-endopeptidase MepM/ murein hydrolase activator NlpD